MFAIFGAPAATRTNAASWSGIKSWEIQTHQQLTCCRSLKPEPMLNANAVSGLARAARPTAAGAPPVQRGAGQVNTCQGAGGSSTLARQSKSPKFVSQRGANPSLKRTHTGMPFQALISFWAFHALPARAA